MGYLNRMWPKDIEERGTEYLHGMAKVTEHVELYNRQQIINYGGARVPIFLSHLLRGGPCQTTQAYNLNKKMVLVSGDFIIRPNPNYFDYEWCTAPHRAKLDPRGFRLCAWWIHPRLQQLSPYFNLSLIHI